MAMGKHRKHYRTENEKAPGPGALIRGVLLAVKKRGRRILNQHPEVMRTEKHVSLSL